MEKNKKNKKSAQYKVSIVLRTLVVLTILSAILLSTLLGVTKAEYFKTFSKKLDLETKPDLTFQYYLYDATLDSSAIPTSTYKGKTGAYKNAKNISQPLSVGKRTQHSNGGSQESVYYGAQWAQTEHNPDFTTTNTTDTFKYFGEDVVYQIKIPVSETGYYKLDFTVDFWERTKDTEPIDIYTQNYDFAVGCEILNNNDGFIFYGDDERYISSSLSAEPSDKPSRLELWSRNNNKVIGSRSNNTYVSSENQNVTLLESDSLYQWKTLNPSRAERVSLTFKAESTDVKNGYVIWMWEFAGLKGPLTYNLELLDIAIEKTMETDGSTKHRDADSDPFFMFPQAEMANNQAVLSIPDTKEINNYDTTGVNGVRGEEKRGVTSYSRGRGSYVTNATANGITLQAETLFYGYTKSGNTVNYLDAIDDNVYSNPVSLRVPLKNVKFNTTYRVVFDFSLARQGTLSSEHDWAVTDLNKGQFSDYATHDKILRTTQKSFAFQSYLYSPTDPSDVARNMPSHEISIAQVQYNNKAYQGKPLTNYGDIMSRTDISGYDRIDYSTSTSVNDTYSIKNIEGNNESTAQKNLTSMRNWYNAIQHTEYNAQNEIHWITFYNTSFSFNIKDENDVNLNNLYWVWAIDSLIRGSFYRIKIENVRIEEVVEYGSGFNKNGVKISGVPLSQVDHSEHYHDSDNADNVRGMFAAFRGMAGTGQNYQAKGWVLDEYMTDATKKVLTSATNIYSPIIDATKFQLLRDDPNDYKIELDGWAVLKGGVRKYVFSVDGGLTWEDMTFSGVNAGETYRGYAEDSVDQYYSGTTKLTTDAKITAAGLTVDKVDHVSFNEDDGRNGDFSGYRLVANLEKYKNQANLDIIIAAVPMSNKDLRCEMLRIINFNQVKNYVTFPMDFVSDISVKNTLYDPNGATTPLNVHRIEDSVGHYCYDDAKAEGMGFSFAKTWFLNDGENTSIGPATTTGYARMASTSNSYEDIRTSRTGFAVEKTLGITGWAIVEGGVQGYYWSADHGNTWFSCSGTAVKYDNSANNYLVSPQYADYFYSKDGKNDATIGIDKHRFEDSLNGAFSGNTTSNGYQTGDMLTADLSDYVGKSVDVIFAAKPNGSDVYVPVGRCDNVGVYGDPTLEKDAAGRGMGAFYTKLGEVKIDGEKVDMYYHDGDDYLSRYGYKPGLGFHHLALTYLEPYHVNFKNTRFYNQSVQSVKSGGTIEIDGFIMVEGGVKQYKYSLDGGDTWTIMHTSTVTDFNDVPTDQYEPDTTVLSRDSLQIMAQRVDASFDLSGDDGRGVSFRSNESSKLVAVLPALPEGAERNLLIVAESNVEDNSGTGSGFLYPVFHAKIRVEEDNTGFFLNDANGAQAGYYSHGSFSQTFKTGSSAAGTSYKLTFPVSKEGVHTLTFDAALTLDSEGVVSERTNVNIYQAWDASARIVHTGYANTIKISVDKTDFMEGEDINVSYYADVRGNRTETGAGVLGDAVICIARLEDDGSLRVYEERKSDNSYGGEWPHYERAVYVVKGTDSIQNNMTGVRSGEVNLKDGLTEKELADAIPQSRNSVLGLEPHLPAGKYRIYFYNDESIRFGNVALGIANSAGASFGQLLLTDPIDITIHSAAEYSDDIATAVLHEETEIGGERYFASKEADKSKGGTVDNVANKTLDNAFTAQDVELYFNATAEDVKRGYVVLDWDLSQLSPNTNYVLDIDNLMYGYGVKLTKRLVIDEDGNAIDANGNDSFKIKVPALEVGTHNFAFSSYTSAYSPIIHNGLNQTVCYGNTNRNHGGNYLAAGAYMSVEKNIFTVGEPIHVSYSTAGAGTCTNPDPSNHPWIGITKFDTEINRDVVIGKVYLEKDAVGKVTFRSGMDGCTEINEVLANLPAGDYKLYFRDNSALIYGDMHSTPGTPDNKGEYWPQMNITDPIAITIIDPNKSNEKPYKQTYYFDDVWYDWNKNGNDYKNHVSGWVSIDKTVFRVGEKITFDYEKRDLKGNPAKDGSVHVGFAAPNYTGVDFFASGTTYGNLESKMIDLSKVNPAPGRYQLYICDYGYASARAHGSVIGVFDIVILPAVDSANPSTLTMSYDHLNSENVKLVEPYDPISAYDYSRNPISINVTKEDVERGYVEFEYKLENLNLAPNTKVIYTTEMFNDDAVYTIIEKTVGDSSTYRVNYSALKNELQDQIENPWIYNSNRTQQVPDYYKDSYMEVSKTYFNVGEPINVKYRYNTKLTASSEKAWICIATMGNEEGTVKDSYIRWKEVTRSSTFDTFDITQADGESQNAYAESLRNLPAGEYKIWFIYGPATSNWWDYTQIGDGQNYNNPYINGNAVTEPICIKIVDPDDPQKNDNSLEYKAWVGMDGDNHGNAKYAHIKLEKNVFMQGEPIKAAFNGRTEYMYVWLHNDEDNTEIKKYYSAAELTTDEKSTDDWKGFYSLEETKNLLPGNYKLYYAVYSDKTIDSVFRSGAIVAIIDITILPKKLEDAPTLKLYAVYTNTEGKQVRRPIDDAIVVDNRLNNTTDNDILTDNDNKVEGIVEFTDVKPNSKIYFYFTYKIGGNVSSDDHFRCTVEEVPWETYDIKYTNVPNFQISKNEFMYNIRTDSSRNRFYDAKISLPGTYFVEGEPINFTYDYSQSKIYDENKKEYVSIDGENIAIIVTTETYVYNVAFDYNNDGTLDTTKGDRKDDFWMTGVIKYRTLQSDGKQHLPKSNTVNLNKILYNPDSKYMSYVSGASKYTPQTLPVGTYKVWLFRNDGLTIGSYEIGMDPFKKMAPLMLCEPITFKVIDRDNPDFSISSSMYAPYFGKQTAGHDTFNSTLTIEKAIFKKGEPIYFNVDEDYCARQVYITPGLNNNLDDDGDLEADRVYRFDRPGVWQYAEYGVKSLDVTDKRYYNYLDTSSLLPGQYKIYYFMGENVQKAYRGDAFSLGGNHNTKCKIYTIIDIIILPEDVYQSVTVNYTKYDGTSASVTSSNLPFGGTALSTTEGIRHIWHKYHMGVYYTNTITDVKPGTEITVTVNNNVAATHPTSWVNLISDPTVLQDTKRKVQNP